MNARTELVWKDLSLYTDGRKRILYEASGSVEQGRLVALMGPSGAGKSTLLNVIAGRIPSKFTLEGSILINGSERDMETWPHLIAYVPQHIHAHDWQTVHEILHFAAVAKHGKGPLAEKKVAHEMEQLGLCSVRNTYFAHLSGGERMRLSVGIEMMGDPKILLLDEPLSGLDSKNASNLLDVLKRLSASGKIVIMTIHQPSYKMLCCFDEIILMCAGSPVYSGTVDGCLEFFSACGFELPKNTNPADFFIDTISCTHGSSADYEATIESIKQEWRFAAPEVAPRYFHPLDASSKTGRTAQPFLSLFMRDVLNIMRNSKTLRARLIQKLVIGCICGLSFFRLGVANADEHSLRGVFSYIIFNEFFGNTSIVLNRYALEKNIVVRERMSGFYNGYAAYWSMLLAELSGCIAIDMPFTFLTYLLVGFSFEIWRVFQFFAAISSLVFFAESYALTVGICSDNANSAQFIGGTINVVMTLFSGTFSKPSAIPALLRWLMWLSPVSYTYRATMQSQVLGKRVQNVSGEELMASFGLDGVSTPICILLVLLMAFAFQVAGVFALHNKTKANLKMCVNSKYVK